MAISSRVQKEQSDKITDFAFYGGVEYVLHLGRSGKVRVYESNTGYSQTSGQTLGRGKIERDAEGKPVEFSSLSLAHKWIEAGMPVLDSTHEPIDWSQW